jgi:hypothetical protein
MKALADLVSDEDLIFIDGTFHVSSHGTWGKQAPLGFFNQGTNLTDEKALFPMTNHLPGASPPNTITLRSRISTNEWGWVGRCVSLQVQVEYARIRKAKSLRAAVPRHIC